MQAPHKSLVLIGMPGAGKSTLGVQLAKSCALPFIDTDLLIQQAISDTLQNYLNMHGYLALREREEQQLLNSHLDHAIVATGGSVVYSQSGMQRLQKIGVCVYLHIDFATLQSRVTNQSSRGLAVAKGTTLDALYNERLALYKQWATHTINCVDKTQETILTELEKIYRQHCIAKAN